MTQYKTLLMHLRFEQSAAPPFQPGKHWQILSAEQIPFPEQELGHAINALRKHRANINKTKILSNLWKEIRSILQINYDVDNK